MAVPEISPPLHEVMSHWPEGVRSIAARLRELIHEASEEANIGPVEESLKWGQPSFSNGKPGSPLRLGYREGDTYPVRIYVHCGTTLIDQFRTRFTGLHFEKNRAVCLSTEEPLPEDILKTCFALALTYHQRKQAENPK